MNGKEIADNFKKNIAYQIKKLPQPPRLAVVLVGNDPASEIYISKKKAACNEVGIFSTTHFVPDGLSTDHITQIINDLNNRDHHGILVQLPLPPYLDKIKILNKISPVKDVDCFTSTNLGLLAQNSSLFEPCTPAAIISILKHYEIDIHGKNVVIINDSIVVGRSLAMMLLNLQATPTICHKQTENLKEICLSSDIIVSAVGKPDFKLTSDMVRKNATVIDVGINRIGNKIIGDVDEGVKEKAGYLTPPSGGVGPVTCAMLMRNTLIAARNQV